jgi:hypothetical protein
MLKRVHRTGRLVAAAALLLAAYGFIGPKLAPEMKAVIDSFADRAKRAAVMQQYGEQGVVPPELTLCEMAKPVVNAVETLEGVLFYTLESRVERCENSPAAAGTVRIFRLGWKNGRIVRFEWLGPKGGKVEY